LYAYDFEYDGKRLSDFGMIVCSFSGGYNASNADKGSEIKFNMVPSGYGKRFFVAGLQYENCLSTSFQICKNPDVFREEHLIITSEEFRELSRWLNRKKFLWFRSFDLCEPQKQKPWFRASFNLTRIDAGKETVGIELNMVTDSPFGYGDEEEISLSFTTGNLSKVIQDMSDEIGELYPLTQITCSQSGDITLSCDVTGCSTKIESCTLNEVITLSGDTLIVSTSNTNHDIANDFNYDFFRIGNTAATRENTITASAPCTVLLKYRPILKDTL
jgi:hypothetical protein